MSQHLITQFINRRYVFKRFNGAKLINDKLKKYPASHRHHHHSSHDIVATRDMPSVSADDQPETSDPVPTSHIDISV